VGVIGQGRRATSQRRLGLWPQGLPDVDGWAATRATDSYLPDGAVRGLAYLHSSGIAIVPAEVVAVGPRRRDR